MALVHLFVVFWIFQTQFHRVSPQDVTVYSRAGDDVTLPWDSLKDHGPNCSDVTWGHFKYYQGPYVLKVSKGSVAPSERSRLSLDSDCSLRLHKVTEDDAGAFYRGLEGTNSSSFVYLDILSVSEAEAEADGSVTLQCSLRTYFQECNHASFRWLVQNQEVPSLLRVSCVSYVTVEPQTENTTVTCEFMEGNEVKVSVEHSLNGTESVHPQNPDTAAPKGDCEQSHTSTGWSWFLVLKTVGWTILISATVIVSICTRDTGKPKRSRGNFEMVCEAGVSPGNTAAAADYENQE